MIAKTNSMAKNSMKAIKGVAELDEGDVVAFDRDLLEDLKSEGRRLRSE